MAVSPPHERMDVGPQRVWAQASWRTRFNLTLLVVFLAIVLLFGGASRADVLGQAVVRFAAILMIAAVMLQLDREAWHRVRVPASFLLALTAVVAIQLVPLPPGIWASLPGRSIYVQALELGGIPPAWRPLSLTPDLTLNSLLAALPAFATILGLSLVRSHWSPMFVPVLLVGIAASALIGVVQISTGSPYLYRITNLGSAVGFFANRNHEGLFIALAFPLLAGFAGFAGSRARVAARTWLAVSAAAAIFPLLLVTGSRGGLLLGIIGSVCGGAILYGAIRLRPWAHRVSSVRRWLIFGVPVALGAAAIFVFRYFGRDVAIQRIIGGDITTVRADFLPIYKRMAEDFFPTGGGFGSFDTLFRVYEPHWALDRTYLNHAHNDLAELVIEGGAPALAVLLAFMIWYLIRCIKLWIRPVTGGDQLLGRVGSTVIAMIMLGSLVDYPLRTPIISVVFAMACYWIAAPRPRHSDVGLSPPVTSGIPAAADSLIRTNP